MSRDHSTPEISNASKESPCPICNGTDWCWLKFNNKNEVTLVGCRRTGDDVRVDASGCEYYLHRLGKGDDDYEPTERVRLPQTEPLDADLLHAVYSAFLGTLRVSSNHRTSLMNRGFTAEEIDRLGYKSMPTKLDDVTKAVDAVVKALKAHDAETWKGLFVRVPGFFIRDLRDNPTPRFERELEAAHEAKDQAEIERIRKELKIAGWAERELVGEVNEMVRLEGIVLPLRDLKGRIHSLQIRLDDPPDDKNKYRLFSNPKRGAKAGVRPHVPVHAAEMATETVRFVEGAFKADLATIRTAELCVSYSSATAWRQTIPIITELGVKTAVLPFDADVRTNANVASAMTRFVCNLANRQVPFIVETWDPKFGKGIDDVLASNPKEAITGRSGRAAWTFVEDFNASSGAKPNPEVLVNKILSDVVEKAGKDATTLFDKNVISAAAFLGDGPRYRKLLEDLKGAGVPVTDWKRSVVKQVKRFDKMKAEQKALAAGKRIFERGDETEIGIALLDAFADKDRHGKLRHESLVFDEGSLYRFDRSEGIWLKPTEKEQTLVVQGFAGSPLATGNSTLKINSKTEQGAIRLAHRRVKDDGFFSDAPVGFAFKNGFVEVSAEGLNLRQHQGDDRARYKFEFDFLPSPRTDRWLNFLDDLFINDVDKTERIAFLQEFLGASLIGITPTYGAVVLVLLGEGNNGKSKLAQIIEGCFPPGSTCALAPHRWREDYHVGQLAGKRLNIVGELPSRELQDSEIFKLIVTAEQKVRARSPFKEPFEFLAQAGHLFLANKLPGSSDQTLGFWRRFVLMPLTRIFIEGADEDKDIVAKVFEDKAGIVNWLLEGAVAVLRRGRISKAPASSEAAKAAWQLDADPVRRFVMTGTEIDVSTDGMSSLAGLYSSWKDWAQTKGHKAMAENTFGSRLKSVMIDMVRKNRAQFEGLTDKRLEGLLRDGHIMTKNGVRYPLRVRPVDDGMSSDDLDELLKEAQVVDISTARKAGR
jgi:putative DNA primase/helicase